MVTDPPRAVGGALSHLLRRLRLLLGSATTAARALVAPALAVTPNRSSATLNAFALGLPALGDDPDHDRPAAADDHDLWWSDEPAGDGSGADADRVAADRSMAELSLSHQERPGVDAIEALERLSLSGRRTRGQDPWASGPINVLDRLG